MKTATRRVGALRIVGEMPWGRKRKTPPVRLRGRRGEVKPSYTLALGIRGRSSVPRRGHGRGQTPLQWPISNSKGGAGDGLRTRYLDLGKVALYQVSYSRSAKRRSYPGPSGAQGVQGDRQCTKRVPHLSRSWFTRIADSCSITRSRRPDWTAALTAAIASA